MIKAPSDATVKLPGVISQSVSISGTGTSAPDAPRGEGDVATNRPSSDNWSTVSRDLDARVSAMRASDATLYPHLFDTNQAPGQVLTFIKNAESDAREALDAFNNGNFPELSSRLTYIAGAAGQAFPLTTFNEDFGVVVAFIRRATLAADAWAIERSALNVLITVLRELSKRPALDLDEAGAMVDKLRNEGWDGRHAGAEALLAELFPVQTEVHAMPVAGQTMTDVLGLSDGP